MSEINIKQILSDFSNNTNPSCEDFALACYARDLDMNLTFEDQFNWAMKKLRYHPTTFQSTLEGRINSRIKELTQEYHNSGNNSIINVEKIKKELTTQFEKDKRKKVEKFNHFTNIFQSNDHLRFYQSMNLSELEYLGF